MAGHQNASHSVMGSPPMSGSACSTMAPRLSKVLAAAATAASTSG